MEASQPLAGMDPRLGEWVEGRGTGMEDLLVMVERRVEVGGDEE